MRLRFVPVLLAFTFALSAAPTIRLDLKLASNEWISAAQVNDDGAGVIVVAQTKPRMTRLVRFGGDGIGETTRVDGIAINHFETLPDAGDNRYLIAGSVDGQYVHRVVEWKRSSLRTVWESNAHPYIRVSQDGRLWGSVAHVNGKLKFTWGELAHRTPRATISVESSPLELPDGFVFDGTDLVFVRPNVAAALWSGRVYLFDLTAGSVAAMLAPPAGGATLEFDRAKDTLWIGGNEWSAFSITDALRGEIRPKATRRTAVPNAAPHAMVRVSAAGRAVLIATDGPLGSKVEIRRSSN